MSEMVERIAQLIANGGDWQMSYNEEQREFHRRRARLAIEAIREPTEAMLDAGVNAPRGETNWRDAMKVSWRAMIDEALK